MFVASGRSYQEWIAILADDLLARTVVPFLGAGVSRAEPSGLPLALTLKQPLVDLLTGLDVFRLHAGGDAARASIAEQLRRAPLERVLDAFHAVYGPPAMDWLSVLDGGHPNENHNSMAALAAGGRLPHIITLNFDRLLERAMDERSVGCRTMCTLIDRGFTTGVSPSVCQITKPHGSIWPCSGERFRHLGATISQVGTHVARRTRHALRAVFRECHTLLVAGYSGADWDILPILMDPDSGISRVIWIKHSNRDPLSTELYRWIDSFGPNGDVLVGDCRELMRDLCAVLALVGRSPVDAAGNSGGRSAVHFFPDTLRNALVLAELVHNDGVKTPILRSLGNLEHPALEARRLLGLGAIAHTSGDPQEAIKFNWAAWRLNRRHRLDLASRADQLLWLGYEYLCLAKRGRFTPTAVIRAAGNLVTGVVLIGFAAQCGCGASRRKREALVAYYGVDLLHSWTTLIVQRGPASVRRWRWLFRLLARGYSFAESLDLDRMEWEYYRLRLREAQMLGGMKLDYFAVRTELMNIRESYRMVCNQTQLGNPHVYLALLDFVTGRHGPAIAAELDAAEKIWSEPGSKTGSGLRRVALYRKFCLRAGEP